MCLNFLLLFLFPFLRYLLIRLLQNDGRKHPYVVRHCQHASRYQPQTPKLHAAAATNCISSWFCSDHQKNHDQTWYSNHKMQQPCCMNVAAYRNPLTNTTHKYSVTTTSNSHHIAKFRFVSTTRKLAKTIDSKINIKSWNHISKHTRMTPQNHRRCLPRPPQKSTLNGGVID